MNHLVQYARKVEGDMYDTAASRVSVGFFLYLIAIIMIWFPVLHIQMA